MEQTTNLFIQEDMIQSKELRIGNYFTHNNEWNAYEHKGMFQWSDTDWYSLFECTLFLDNVSPISLTEEILLKCGFYIRPRD